MGLKKEENQKAVCDCPLCTIFGSPSISNNEHGAGKCIPLAAVRQAIDELWEKAANKDDYAGCDILAELKRKLGV